MKKINEKEKADEFIYQLNQQSTTNTINYVTVSCLDGEITETPYFTGDSTDSNQVFEWFDNDTFPTFLSQPRSIVIPKGVKRHLQRLPRKIFLEIDKDIEVAIEKCLIVVSNLTFTVFSEDKDKWKNLSSTILQEQIQTKGDNTFIYNKALNVLQYRTNKTSSIIESRLNYYGTSTYEVGKNSKQFRFTTQFDKPNFERYDLKTQEIIDKRFKYQIAKLNEAIKNPIGKNLIQVYQYIELPSMEEILSKAKELVNQGFRSKKGKKLTFLNKKTKTYFKDFETRSYVEENIKQYSFLVNNGYLTPNVGDYKSGGRVVDSFNLMPSWIRSIVKIDNEEIVELDYKALHPNIAISLYKGSTKYLTHDKVANFLKEELSNVKIEHLSFFNKKVTDMMRSPLYYYYSKEEPEMLERIIKDKLENGYKITSRKLFSKEVEIMKSVIETLNKMGIYVLYVYDALYCKKSDGKLVMDVMNKIILKEKVFTEVK